MEGNTNNWATPSMKEFVFWHDGMTPEEFEEERHYYYTMMYQEKLADYKPLWQTK